MTIKPPTECILMPTKAIFFDIDNTLYDTSKFAERARRNAINAMRESGLEASEREAYATLLRVIERRTSNYGRHFDEMIEELGERPSPRLVAAGIVAYHNTKASILPFPEVKRTLLWLRDSGYLLYAASEGQTLKQWDKLMRLGLHLMFHDVFVTEEFGGAKSRGFYSKILERLKLQPSASVMVGDSPAKDILPARAAGMWTILVTHGRRQRCKTDAMIMDLSGLPAALKRF
jgi:putative hydrolase of the HAD superfamily